jgi:hypothetical protein
MPGLDPSIIEQMDPRLSIGRILRDQKSDFILSPHYASIFVHSGEDLWEQLESSLRSGSFEPELPITVEVPKPTGLTRPGSILKPMDRLIYQALIDVLAPIAERNIDRSRAFSYILLDPDPEFRMFEDHHDCLNQLQESIKQYSEDPRWSYAIRADVANFFERLYQHVLINLLHSSGCPSGAVNLLEQLLSLWMERDSHGILQGMFPSDFLGNFYLVGLDSSLEVLGVPSARFVDDLYIFYGSKPDAQKGMTELCKSLRREGLHLSDRKSQILEVEKLIHEETQIDRMFEEARLELEGEALSEDWYGFQSIWLSDEEELSEEEITLHAVETLYQRVEDPDVPSDRIELFCLPSLAESGSEVAVERALDGLVERPYLAKVYSSYLWRIARSNSDIGERMEHVLREREFSYDWQIIWPIAALLNSDSVERTTVTKVIRILRDPSYSAALRALCAIFVGKHSGPGQRRSLIQQYSNESSDYVHAAILFASRYFPAAERRACIRAWSGHSRINTLVGKAVQKIVQNPFAP